MAPYVVMGFWIVLKLWAGEVRSENPVERCRNLLLKFEPESTFGDTKGRLFMKG